MRLLTVGLLTLAARVSAAQTPASIPPWFLTPPVTPGAVTGQGVGESKLSALASAIGSAADQFTVVSSRAERVTAGAPAQGNASPGSRSIANQRIGGLLVETLTKQFLEVSSTDSTRTFTRMVRVRTADSSVMLSFFMNQTNDEDPLLSVELNGRLQVVLDELAKVGARLRTQELGNNYYVLLTVPLPKRP